MSRFIKIEGHREAHRLLGRIVSSDPSCIPLFYDLWLSARTGQPLRTPEPGLGGTSTVPKGHIDILLLPLQQRANFAGACEVVAGTIAQRSPDTRVGIVETETYAASDLARRDATVFRFVDVTGPLPEDLRPTPSADTMYAAVRDHPLMAQVGDAGLIQAQNAEHRRQIEAWRRFLRERHVQLVLTPVEFLPAAAVIMAAAKLEGVPFVQILHGTPVEFYAPFFSDEMWVWSERTRQSFIDYGVPPQRLRIIGNLEVAYLKHQAKPESSGLDRPRQKVLLFFLQDISKSYCIKDLETLREAFALLSDEWSLRIRLTSGHQGRGFENLINEWFGGFDGRVVYTCNRPFFEDVVDADVVCAGSTSATFTAMAFGYKTVILWNDESYEQRGKAMADERRVCSTPQELAERVMNVDAIPDVDETELANVGNADVVAAEAILGFLKEA